MRTLLKRCFFIKRPGAGNLKLGEKQFGQAHIQLAPALHQDREVVEEQAKMIRGDGGDIVVSECHIEGPVYSFAECEIAAADSHGRYIGDAFHTGGRTQHFQLGEIKTQIPKEQAAPGPLRPLWRLMF